MLVGDLEAANERHSRHRCPIRASPVHLPLGVRKVGRLTLIYLNSQIQCVLSVVLPLRLQACVCNMHRGYSQFLTDVFKEDLKSKTLGVVNCLAAVGTIPFHIEKQIWKKFRSHKCLTRPQFSVGDVFVLKTPRVASFLIVTKKFPRQKPAIQDLKSCFAKVAEHCRDLKLKQLILTRSGLERVRSCTIRKIVSDSFRDYPVTIIRWPF